MGNADNPSPLSSPSPDPAGRIDHVLVLGGGSAGFLAALALKSKLPDLKVTVVRSRDIGIIGVGEGSTVGLTDFLHNFVGVGPKKFFEVAQPTWKLGLKFVEWGPRPSFHYSFSPTQLDGRIPGLRRNKSFYCETEMESEDLMSAMMSHNRVFERRPNGNPAVHTRLAYHFENEKFVRFLEGYASALGVVVVDDTVTEVEQDERGVAALRLASGRRESADLFLDCSGFASVLLGKALGVPFVPFDRSLFCDRAVVGGWDRKDSPDPPDHVIRPYTTCQTMNHGWCWRIEHENRINRGYVYSSAFVSDEEAEREFRDKNPKVGPASPTRVVRFFPGRYRELWVKNVVAIGNASGFVEPLEATALGVIAHQGRTLAMTLLDADRRVTPSMRKHYNLFHTRNWDGIRDFLAVHYKFNDRLDTPFWRHCRAETDLAGAEAVVEVYRENGPTFLFADTVLDSSNQFGMGGYNAVLLGMRAPVDQPYQPSDKEVKAWDAVCQRHRQAALQGLTVSQSLEAIRSPRWEWRTP